MRHVVDLRVQATLIEAWRGRIGGGVRRAISDRRSEDIE